MRNGTDEGKRGLIQRLLPQLKRRKGWAEKKLFSRKQWVRFGTLVVFMVSRHFSPILPQSTQRPLKKQYVKLDGTDHILATLCLMVHNGDLNIIVFRINGFCDLRALCGEIFGLEGQV